MYEDNFKINSLFINLILNFDDIHEYYHEINIILKLNIEPEFITSIDNLILYIKKILLNNNEVNEDALTISQDPSSKKQTNFSLEISKAQLLFYSTLMSLVNNETHSVLELDDIQFSIKPTEKTEQWTEKFKRICLVFILITIRNIGNTDKLGLYTVDQGNKERLLALFNSIKPIFRQIYINYQEDTITLDAGIKTLIWNNNKSYPTHYFDSLEDTTPDSGLKITPLFSDVIDYFHSIQQQNLSHDFFMGSPSLSTLKVPLIHNKYFDNLAEKIKSGKEVLITPRELSIILYPYKEDITTRENQLRYLCHLLYKNELDFRDEWEGSTAAGINDQVKIFEIISDLEFSLDQYYTRLSKKKPKSEINLDLGEKHGSYPWETGKKNKKTHSPIHFKQINALQSLIEKWKCLYEFDLDETTINENLVKRIMLPITSPELVKILKKISPVSFKEISVRADIRSQNFWNFPLRQELCIFKNKRQCTSGSNRITRDLILKNFLNN